MSARRRTATVAALALACAPLTAVAATNGAASAGPPQATARDHIGPDKPAHGEAAVEALGDRLDEAAAVNGMTTGELRDLLLGDPTAWVDRSGRVFFKERLRAPHPDQKDESGADATVEAADAFTLHSKPGSQHVIFLDFDGAEVSGTAWNDNYGVNATHPAWTLDGDASTFNTNERNAMGSIWARVAEDYAPFDVDVTTEDPGAAAIDRTDGSDPTYGTRVLISPSSDAINKICVGGCGGVAYLDVFDIAGSNHAYHQPAWVFPQALGNGTKLIAEASSHEVGHNFGLNHDGNGGPYYGGHAMWAPIMGNSYSRPVSQWSRGGYAGANNGEDDLAIIAANGAPLRTDEAGGTVGTAAAALPAEAAYITTRGDVDAYALGFCAGTLSLVATPVPTSPNLDLKLSLLASGGSTVASANPASAYSSSDVATGMGASLAPSVPVGRYFLAVDGVGNGTAATGYDDYASLGSYTLAVAGCGLDEPEITRPGAPRIGTASSGPPGGRRTAIATWSAPTTTGGAAISGYQVRALRQRQGVVVATFDSARKPANARRLSRTLPQGRYRFVVRALNSAGWGAWSARSNVVRSR